MSRLGTRIDQVVATEGGDALLTQSMPVLLDNLRAVDTRISRMMTLLLALCLGCEFLAQAAIGEIEVMGVKLTNLAYVEQLAPVAIAYVYFASWSLLSTRRLLEEIHDSIVLRLQRPLFEQDLELHLRPPQAFKTMHFLARANPGWLGGLLMLSGVPAVLLFGLAVPLYAAAAITRLFWKYGSTWPVLGAAVVTLFFVVQVGLLLLAFHRVTSPGSADAAASVKAG